MRSYADFARRSPLPAREDGRASAPRNSPALVNASLPRRGGAYALVLAGTDPSVPDGLRLPEAFRVDVAAASDAALVDAVARLISAYVEQLVFEQEADGAFAGPPFDRFLEADELPRRPRARESAEAYTRRLRNALARLRAPLYVATDPSRSTTRSVASDRSSWPGCASS
jgi:hypothetical protein